MPMAQKAERDLCDPRGLQEILSFLAEGVVVLDERGDFVWVNDSMIRIHGADSARTLGKNYKDYASRYELRYRNNHRLTPDIYPMARAMAGDLFNDMVVEVHPAGEDDTFHVHSIRSYVAADPTNGKSLVFIIATDLTQQCEAEQRFEAAFNANPAPAVICRLADLRYVKVNPGFLEMTGYGRDGIIGHSAYEIDVLADAQRRDLALERLKENRTVPQMEAHIPLPDGGKKFVIVAGEPILIAEEPCMLFTFADLDPVKNTEHALRQSEERFSKSFHLSAMPQIITTLKDFRITEVNQTFHDLFGYAEDEVAGRTATDFFLWEDRFAQHQIEDSLETTGCIKAADLIMQAKDGTPIDCIVSVVTVSIGGEDCVLWAINDITERKRSEDELVAAIEAVMEDTSWFSRTVVEKLASLRPANRPLPSSIQFDELTDRERDVLNLICQGRSDAQMSQALGLSPNTVRNHVSSLFRKIGVNRRAAAIIWARERGLTGQENGRPSSQRKSAKKPPRK